MLRKGQLVVQDEAKKFEGNDNFDSDTIEGHERWSEISRSMDIHHFRFGWVCNKPIVTTIQREVVKVSLQVFSHGGTGFGAGN